MSRTAIVSGCTGINGGNLVDHLLHSIDECGEWTVIGIGRREPTTWPWFKNPKFKFVAMDLMDENECYNQLLKCPDAFKVTCYFHAAYIHGKDEQEMIDKNVPMLRNCLNAVEKACPSLKRVGLYTGVKYYGVHLGPYKTPAKEGDPRLKVPLFYYNQEDLLAEKQKGKNWVYHVIRPNEVIGYSPWSPMNLLQSIAVYATMCKELKLPFRFPGTYKSYRQLYDCSSVKLNSSMMEWLARNEKTATQNQAFNCVNGDCYRYIYFWPKICKYFDVECVEPKETDTEPFSVAAYFKGKDKDWETIVKRYDLQPTKLSEISSFAFMDWSLSKEYDAVTSMNKAKKAGFLEFKDTEEDFIERFDELKKLKIIPQ